MKEARPQVEPASARALLAEGLVSGLVLGLAEWLAMGPVRAPFALALVVWVLPTLGGLFAGLVALPLRRGGLPTALCLAGAVALQGASVVTKELGGSATLLAVVAGLAALALVVACLDPF